MRLKAQLGAKKANDTALTLKTQENAIKKTIDKRFAIPLDFDFFKHPMYPYGLKEDLIVKLELNYSEKVILCSGDTSATQKFSDISLEYDAVFDEPHATSTGEMYAGTTSIPYTKVTSNHYQTLTLPGRLMWLILLFGHCKVCCYYSLTNLMVLPTRMKNFTIQASKKFWSQLMACPTSSL